MKRLDLFSWMKPAIEDLHYERDAKELHIKKRIIDLTGGGTGILKDVGNELDVYVADPLQFLEAKVKDGEAYIQGEKIEIANEQTVNLDDVETEANIIWLKYKLGDSSDSQAVRGHSLTGVPYNVWKTDSFELGATKESLYVDTADVLKLRRVAKVGSELKVTHDYRTWLTIDNDVVPDEVLRKQSAPPVPTRLDLSTGWDDIYRKTGESAGLISHRPAYIKAEFGDNGQGTASGITFTKTSNRIGDWIVDEWANYYLTCSDGNSWKVVSNTVDTLTLETGAAPVNGAFWLGPNAAGYKFVIYTLSKDTEEVVAVAEVETQSEESPVKMEFIWQGLTADVKYKIKIASKGGWFQDEWSDFCLPEAIIAGGAKEIPDVCGDVLDGEPTISAEDDGIRISWSVKSEYVDKVAGFEFCWTDDGSTPSFNNKSHRKIFTDRNFVVLPAKMSNEDTPVIVKAKMRCVDKAGRHCTTPKTLPDTTAKKYPADLLTIVTDRKNILDHGGFASMEDFLSKSINLSDGRLKGITEVESYLAELCGSYSTPGERLNAIARAAVNWENVRIVAQNDTGHYSTPQAAIDSIVTPDHHVLLMMPGQYDDPIDYKDRVISIIGVGDPEDVVIGPNEGRIYSSAAKTDRKLVTVKNIMVACVNQTYSVVVDVTNATPTGIPSRTFLDNIAIQVDGSADQISLQIDTYNIWINRLKTRTEKYYCMNIAPSLSGSQLCNIYVRDSWFGSFGDDECIRVACTTQYVYLRLWNTDLRVENANYSIIGSGTKANMVVIPAHCHYNKQPDETTLTVKPGILHNVSNVMFDAGDLGDWKTFES